MIFRGKYDFSKIFCLRDCRVFYRQKSVGPIGPMPQGRGLTRSWARTRKHTWKGTGQAHGQGHSHGHGQGHVNARMETWTLTWTRTRILTMTQTTSIAWWYDSDCGLYNGFLQSADSGKFFTWIIFCGPEAHFCIYSPLVPRRGQPTVKYHPRMAGHLRIGSPPVSWGDYRIWTRDCGFTSLVPILMSHH